MARLPGASAICRTPNRTFFASARPGRQNVAILIKRPFCADGTAAVFTRGLLLCR